MIDLREFDNEDWYGNAGATPASDGRQPLIASSLDGVDDPYEVLVDANGIEARVYTVDGDGTPTGFDCYMYNGENYDVNVAVARALEQVNKEELSRFGFQFATHIAF